MLAFPLRALPLKLAGYGVRNAKFLSSLLPQATDVSKQLVSRLEVHHEVITEVEEQLLLKFLQPVLAKRRYEGSHWDSVITRYKEIDLAHYLPRSDAPLSSDNSTEIANQVREINGVLEKVEAFVRRRCEYDDMKFLSTHCIDLASDGHIGNTLPPLYYLLLLSSSSFLTFRV